MAGLKEKQSESKKIAIGSLLNLADEPSKKVLCSYSVTATYKTNLENMKAHNAPVLEACAQLLGFKVREAEKKLYKNQEILCDRMMLRIESLFDTNCDACSTVYRNELKDKPLLKCRLCMQGSHNCEKMNEKAAAFKELIEKGIFPPEGLWLCYECDRKNDLSLQPPLKLSKTRSSQSSSEGILDPIKEHDEEGEEHITSEEDRESPRRNRDDNLNDEQTKTESVVCREYVMRRCPHGLTGKRLINGKDCPHLHPKRCRYYSDFGDDKQRGCKKGENCNFFHPKLCRNSVATRTCFHKDCGFHHLKGTARKTVGATNAGIDRFQPLQQQQYQQQQQRGVRRPDFSQARGQWPPLSSTEPDKMGSLNSVNTAYPPTVDNWRPTRTRKDSYSEREREGAFLEKLLENLKNGIISEMDSKLTKLRDEIPTLIQETQSRSRQLSSQSQLQAPPPQGQVRPPFPMTAPMQPFQLPHQMSLHPNYAGSCY